MNGKSQSERHLVLSDMHFGVNEVSLNNPRVVDVLCQYISDNRPWKTIIFSGDLLDLNLATLTMAVEGEDSTKSHVQGFRDFVAKTVKQLGNASAVENWIYIPGNHDYWVWNTLSTQIVCLAVLACGNHLGTVPTPLMEYKWQGKDTFISGIFPTSVQDRVIVEYPDHIINYHGGNIVITHGHYLDVAQTELQDLCKSFKDGKGHKEAVRRIFIETAQYQEVAHAVSFESRTRRFVDLFFGPGNIRDKVTKFFKTLFKDASNVLISSMRNKPIDAKQLLFIEYYLKCFRNITNTPPTDFIFGHTHKQARASTKDIPAEEKLYTDEIKIYNAGAFFPEDETLSTFLTVEITPGQKPNVTLLNISKDYKVVKS
jgi:UDP-2,3-diacylglucosamine pyrophosphatase LpxH